jgi:hypothetical protein
MSKKIVVFSDGTGNSAARLQKSNVWRLYQALEKTPEQIAYYDDGVGTSSFKPLAILGGAVGYGLARNVRGLYAFLCRNYQPGDEIYAFGFSRGAFTIRILGGLIAARGIVTPGADLKLQVEQEWLAYRRKYRRFGRARAIDPVQHDVTIKFMGLWDTVDAYGFPVEEMRIAWDLFVLPLSMRDRELSSRVLDAYHALSIDDERQTFHPVLWTEKDQNPARYVGDERITQVWFAGVHSNLGGGYPDDSLAHVSLVWMMDQAKRRGLVFNQSYETFARDEADEFGRIYNPRGGLSGLYRYMPRQIADLSMDEKHLGGGMAVEIERPKIHESVFTRVRQGTDSYAPITLPRRYDVVRANGDVVPGVVPDLDGAAQGAQETEAQADQRCQRQAQLWDMVWRRRTLYFVTLAFTLALILTPWLFKPAHLDWGGWTQIFSFVPSVLGWFLPDFLSGWIDSYHGNPALLLLLLLGGLGFGYLGGRKEMQIRRLMRDMWKSWFVPDYVFRNALPSGKLNHFMTWWGKLPLRRWIKYLVVPSLVGLLFYYAGIAIASQLVTRGVESFGVTCGATSSPAEMLTANPCYATGKSVVEGEHYLVRLTVATPWNNTSTPATPEGLQDAGFWSSMLMTAAIPLRRHLTEDWFTVMAKIEPDGLNSQALRFRPMANSNTAWEAEFTASADGALFLYVNDAMLFGWTRFYENNGGSAAIEVKQIAKVTN